MCQKDRTTAHTTENFQQDFDIHLANHAAKQRPDHIIHQDARDDLEVVELA